MRKLCEPDGVAFHEPEFIGSCKEDALEQRKNAFWEGIGENDLHELARKKGVLAIRSSIIDYTIDFLRKSKEELSRAFEKTPELWAWIDQRQWEDVKFIIAFDMYYFYDYMDGDTHVEGGDYLDDEGAFRYDVIKEFTTYLLEGASLARRLNSPAYDKWIDALVMLKDEYDGSKNYKAVDLMAEAYARTWGDLRSWIYTKECDKLKER